MLSEQEQNEFIAMLGEALGGLMDQPTCMMCHTPVEVDGAGLVDSGLIVTLQDAENTVSEPVCPECSQKLIRLIAESALLAAEKAMKKLLD